MATESTRELNEYYAKLLILQYVGKPKAFNTILAITAPLLMPQTSTQLITFSPNPSSGTFVLNYDGVDSAAINWNDNAEDITAILQAIPDLSQVIVGGSITDGLTVLFLGVINIAKLLTVSSNNLNPSTKITITETDLILPLAVQNAFDLETAIGVQLDILGKYTGVKRTVVTKTRTIFLDDDEFRVLIKFAISRNNAGTSLANAENIFNQFFPGDFIITDYKTMYVSFIFGSSIGSKDVFIAIIEEGLLPVPMAVGYNTIIPPVVDQFFGFSTYENGGIPSGNKPFNRYEDFDSNWIFLQYGDFI